MERQCKTIEEVTYTLTRHDILEAMRAVIQDHFPGGGAVDSRTLKQSCNFLGDGGSILPVIGLTIVTSYESTPQAAPVRSEIRPESEDAV